MKDQLLRRWLPTILVIVLMSLFWIATVVLSPTIPTATEQEASALRMIDAFTFDVSDPAGYWGKHSISVPVEHERFDRIIWNDATARFIAFAAIGVKDGKIKSYFTGAPYFRTIVINGRRYSWTWRNENLDLHEKDVAIIAASLTDEELKGITALAELVRDPTVTTRMRKARRFGILRYDIISDFEKQVNELVDVRNARTSRDDAEGDSFAPSKTSSVIAPP